MPPVTLTVPVTPSLPAVPMPVSVTVWPSMLRVVSAVPPPMRPSTAIPRCASTESAWAPSMVLVKVTLPLSEVTAVSAPRATAPFQVCVPPL